MESAQHLTVIKSRNSWGEYEYRVPNYGTIYDWHSLEKDGWTLVREYDNKMIFERKNQSKLPKQRLRKTFTYGSSLEGIQVEDYIVFGEYPYTEKGDTKPLQWIVKEIEDDRLFLISRYVIDVMAYHNSNKKILWAQSQVREWLNTSFINQAFESVWHDRIIPTQIRYRTRDVRSEKIYYCTDKVFILGYDEIENYWPTPACDKKNGVPYSKRKATFTPYVKPKVHTGSLSTYNYLLRDTRNNRIGCVIAKLGGEVPDPYGIYWHYNVIPDGIRPAMWVKR